MEAMENVLSAVISGLLGGGVAGALIGGFITLRAQERQFEQTRTSRFIDLRRERYAELLRATDEWVRAQLEEMGSKNQADPEDPTKPLRGLGVLPPFRPIELLVQEIELIGPEPVAEAAIRFGTAFRSVVAWSDLEPGDGPAMRAVADYNDLSQEYTRRRNEFLNAARVDLGNE